MTESEIPDGVEAGTRSYARRLQAEVEADAVARRRRDPALAARERDLARAWAAVVPPGAAGDTGELLLDRAERLSLVDADVPTGSKPGISQVKRSLRKLLYWNFRYIADQVNAFNGVLIRLLRRLDDRVTTVEDTLALTTTGAEMIDPVGAPSDTVAVAIAGCVTSGPVAVLSCGSGVVVAALEKMAAYGVDSAPEVIVDGSRAGLDLRPGDPTEHLTGLGEASLATVVLGGFVEDLAPAAAHRVLRAALRVVRPGGGIVIAVADPAGRDEIERDLRVGRGLAPATWAHLAERAGARTELVAVDDDRIGSLVVVHRP